MIPGEAIISRADKLEVIRRLDPRWQSPNDVICCTRCGRIFTAREIVVLGGSRGFGPLRLHCPNQSCTGEATEWTASQARSTRDAEVSVSHKGRAFFIRRRKSRQRKAAATEPRPRRSVRAALRRLDADWTGFWRKLGHRFHPI